MRTLLPSLGDCDHDACVHFPLASIDRRNAVLGAEHANRENSCQGVSVQETVSSLSEHVRTCVTLPNGYEQCNTRHRWRKQIEQQGSQNDDVFFVRHVELTVVGWLYGRKRDPDS
jgi:hypothetical protein